MAIPTHWLALVVPFLLIATRLSGLMISGPFYGTNVMPAQVKAGLVVAVSLLLLPAVPAALPGHASLDLVGDGLSELAIGLLLGLVMQVVFQAALLAGSVASFQLGLSLETSIDPTTQADSTVLATLHQMVLIYLFLQMGVHRWVLLALFSSFRGMPLGSSLTALTGAQLLNFSGNLFVWGLELAMPILIATLLIDVTLGFFAKAAPQLPVIFVGIPVKALVGYAVLIAAMQFWPGIFGRHFNDAIQFFLQHAHPIA